MSRLCEFNDGRSLAQSIVMAGQRRDTPADVSGGVVEVGRLECQRMTRGARCLCLILGAEIEVREYKAKA